MAGIALIVLFGRKYNKILLSGFLIIGIYTTLDLLKDNVFNDPIFTSGLKAINLGEKGNFSSRIYGILLPLYEYTVEHSPVWGFGAKNIKYIESKSTFWDVGGPIARRANHNFFIPFLVGWGGVGLLLMLIIYLNNLKLSYRIMRKNNGILPTVLFASWLSFTGMNFIANSFGYKGWTILALLVLTTYYLKRVTNREEFV